MTDILTAAQRSALMARIRGRDTKPEMVVRRMLHGLGFRYRLHRRDLPGRPDIALPRWKAIVQVNGCLWHGHDCPAFKMPASNRAFWQGKIRRNQERDASTTASLAAAGWRVMTVWECALRGAGKLQPDAFGEAMAVFIRSEETASELAGEQLGRPGMPGQPTARDGQSGAG